MPTTRLTDIKKSELFGTSAPTSQDYLRKFQKHISSRNLSNFVKGVSKKTIDRYTKKLELLGTSVPTCQECLQKIPKRYLIQNQRYASV